ncbi:spore coat protein SP96-like [Stomoxys calcitrans]|uniref:spore coat protein SP96-like n=1 Tax=Stomoxys calcitrans TaxID=35570 RepID=UPI0027E2180F|nr:spore coat protein SP96-like [Stomoxys calcitrans]
MEKKIVKKSTPQQLQELVKAMMEDSDLAKGIPVFGGSKYAVDEKWKTITTKLNMHGPPMRTTAEWRKTWADLKSRTKKKLMDNKKSLEATGGGEYAFCALTELEEMVDRAISATRSAVPTGAKYGFCSQQPIMVEEDIVECFTPYVASPPRSNKDVAVNTPKRNGVPDCSKKNYQVVPTNYSLYTSGMATTITDTTAPSSTPAATTVPYSTARPSTAPFSTAPSSAAPSSAAPSRTASYSTAPFSTASFSTAPSNTVPSSTAPSNSAAATMAKKRRMEYEIPSSSAKNSKQEEPTYLIKKQLQIAETTAGIMEKIVAAIDAQTDVFKEVLIEWQKNK